MIHRHEVMMVVMESIRLDIDTALELVESDDFCLDEIVSGSVGDGVETSECHAIADGKLG